MKRGSVLILFNEPVSSAHENASAFTESDAGVLNEVRAVAEALDTRGVPFRAAGVRRLEDVSDAVVCGNESVVVNLVESLREGPVDACAVPSVCRALGRACTGGDSACLALTLDKILTKAALEAGGVPTPAWVAIPPGGSLLPALRLPLPVIVKPARTDASEGIDAASVIRSAGPALEAAVRRLHAQFHQPALVEQFIEGRELNVSVLENSGRVQVLPLAEIDFSAFPPDKVRIVDYAAKWRADTFEYHHTPRKIPADLPAAQAEAVRNLAQEAWRATGCRDYARVDFRLSPDGAPYVLEVNVNPDISPDAGFAAALRAADLSFASFVEIIVRNAGARRAQARAKVEPVKRPPGGGQPHIRRTERRDREPVLRLFRDTGLFRPNELTIAAEVLDDAIADGPGGDYQAFTCELDGEPVGWVCFGHTPCTVGTYDLYWIGVSPALQGRGIGKELMCDAERRIRAGGGRLVVAETAGRPDYQPTRKFYERIGYREEARLKDFYAPDDDLVVFCKRL